MNDDRSLNKIILSFGSLKEPEIMIPKIVSVGFRQEVNSFLRFYSSPISVYF